MSAFTVVLMSSCSKDDKKTDYLKDGAITYTGTMTVTGSDESSFSLENVPVILTENTDKSTVSILMKNVKFAKAMPVTIDMTLKNIPYRLENNSTALACKAVIPEAMQGPFPGYTMTDLSGSFDNTSFTISMTCVDSKINYTGTASTDKN